MQQHQVIIIKLCYQKVVLSNIQVNIYITFCFIIIEFINFYLILVLKRIPIHYSNITALPGMPITLSCPVQSIPTANVTWLHENISIERKLKENRRVKIEKKTIQYECLIFFLYFVKIEL